MGYENKKCFIVIFDVALAASRDALKKRMQAYGYFCPLTDHSWAILSENTAAQVRDNLLPAVASADRLFVIRSGGEGGWRNAFDDKNSEWLKKYL